MQKALCVMALSLMALSMGCATSGDRNGLAEQTSMFEEMLAEQEKISWRNLKKNISPTEPKFPGDPPPAKGVVVAALSKKDPDYYFHWCRDSANVMRTVIEMARHQRQGFSKNQLDEMMADFVRLSKRLQSLKSPYGLGDPRYTVTGDIDWSLWSRPQFDGPALRAHTILNYLDMNPSSNSMALKVVLKDLDFVLQVYNKPSFDIWEELRAENYHTRLVQSAALERGADYLDRHGIYPQSAKRYKNIAQKLLKQLEHHWDPNKGYLRSQMTVEGTDGYTAKLTDLDSAVIIAVVESERVSGPHSVMDHRVHASVGILEELFAKNYPLNQENILGLAYGRYQGDVYYGGNPWFLVSYYFAQFYYRLARELKSGVALPITKHNVGFFQKILKSRELRPDTVIQKRNPVHERLLLALFERADGIMQRLQSHLDFTSGEIYEQFDKSSGLPISSKGIGWGYSTFLGAHLARLDFLSTH